MWLRVNTQLVDRRQPDPKEKSYLTSYYKLQMCGCQNAICYSSVFSEIKLGFPGLKTRDFTHRFFLPPHKNFTAEAKQRSPNLGELQCS